MHALLIAVMSLGAYASGALTARMRMKRARASGPHAVELPIVIAALVVVLRLRSPHISPRDFALVLGMFALGFAVRALLKLRGGIVAGTREFEESRADAAPSPWKRWLNFSRAVVDYEFRLLLIGCYFILIGPFALAFRVLSPAPVQDSTSWSARHTAADLNMARRPF